MPMYTPANSGGPIVATDPTAAWVAEGAEITPSDADLDEVTVTPPKIAGLTIVSRELADDSSPQAADVVGRGLAGDIARKLDAAYFGSLAAPAPAGLPSLTAAQSLVYDVNNLDVFAEAISLAETVGATVTSFVTTPAVALALSQLKEATGSNKPLLAADVTVPARGRSSAYRCSRARRSARTSCGRSRATACTSSYATTRGSRWTGRSTSPRTGSRSRRR